MPWQSLVFSQSAAPVVSLELVSARTEQSAENPFVSPGDWDPATSAELEEPETSAHLEDAG
jgi:hypothetical protein